MGQAPETSAMMSEDNGGGLVTAQCPSQELLSGSICLSNTSECTLPGIPSQEKLKGIASLAQKWQWKLQAF